MKEMHLLHICFLLQTSERAGSKTCGRGNREKDRGIGS